MTVIFNWASFPLSQLLDSPKTVGLTLGWYYFYAYRTLEIYNKNYMNILPSVIIKNGSYLIFLLMYPTYIQSQSSNSPLSIKFDKAFHTSNLLGFIPNSYSNINANSSPVAPEST